MSLSIFILMVSCWMLVASLQGSLLGKHNYPNTEDTGHRILDVIVFIIVLMGLLWAFIYFQWYLVIFLLAISLLVAYCVLLAINVLTGYKDPHLYIIRIKKILDTMIMVCCITLWVSF